MPPAMQAEVDELLTIAGSTVGRMALVGLGGAWESAGSEQIQAALRGMRDSSLALRQQAYHALRDLTSGSYFADESTWAVLGYPVNARSEASALELTMSDQPDPIREGLARGWKVLGGAFKPAPESLNCDVAIVGTGAGAGITAELLTAAGLSVVLIEEGPLKSSTDFRQREVRRLPHAVPGKRQPQDCRQGRRHPAGSLRRRLDHGQLDQLLPHAQGHAGLLARALRPDRR
jgi:hypothetical protein